MNKGRCIILLTRLNLVSGSNPSGIGKTPRIDLVNSLTDITASNYETGLVLSVGGAAVDSAIFINKQ